MPEEKGRFDVGVVNNYELDSCMLFRWKVWRHIMLYTVIILLLTLENGLGNWKRLGWESCHHSTKYN
jgi:hypothetical protein